MKDNTGLITQLGFKDQGIHSIFIISRLILSGRISPYVNKNGKRVRVVVRATTLDIEFSISNEMHIDIDDLDFLPKCNN
ncbi:hypothetical protein [Candidatus Nitrosocosmicus sp. R]